MNTTHSSICSSDFTYPVVNVWSGLVGIYIYECMYINIYTHTRGGVFFMVCKPFSFVKNGIMHILVWPLTLTKTTADMPPSLSTYAFHYVWRRWQKKMTAFMCKKIMQYHCLSAGVSSALPSLVIHLWGNPLWCILKRISVIIAAYGVMKLKDNIVTV